ncbi:MAG TPA: hybrid sensor histidine kinase/response regulator [Candidatus Gastranaerophilales bacterium]|nr:hybrid sensor histidine kinase/response regulator [Candidatus Gastranaerophilales bacterium]
MDFLEHEIEEILNIFREESEEQLQKLNKNLLSLEANPKDHTAISELFREAHSLKGAARMIGLDDIQSIAHKLEDVFGQAKEGYLRITPEIIDVMCRAVDYISSIIIRSIETRGKAEAPEIDKVIESLENIVNANNSADNNLNAEEFIEQEPVLTTQNQTAKETRHNNLKQDPQIGKLLNNISVNIEKLKVFSTSADALEEFLFFVNQLSAALKDHESYRLKGLIEDIQVKVDTAIKGSGILTYEEVSELEDTYDAFLKLYERISFLKNNKPVNSNLNIQEAKNIEIPDVNPVQEKIVSEPVKTANEHQEARDKNIENKDVISFIRNNIKIFSNHTEENSLKFEEIIAKLNGLTATLNEDTIRQIIEKISDLLIFSKEKEAPINPDMINVLEESFDLAVKMLNPAEEIKEDPSLILQRITVLYQMLKLAVSTDVSTPDKRESDEKVSEKLEDHKVSYSPVARNTEIYPKNREQEEEKAKPFDMKFGESNTIKTLRVDTQKLDHLVNQAGELIIAKIKAKEHLTDIEKMIRYLEEWYREWTKTKQYFRYASKYYKPSDSGYAPMQYSPNKSINKFFEENSLKLSGLLSKMNSFYKIVQEDDTRLNLIVNGLEEKIKNIRVLPLATIFHLFPRMVRDIARERNKEIEFFITGSETSVDKKIIEEIKAPLMHIIRNSVDHGIETPAERIEKGKTPMGKILLAAYHLENSVLLEITDDGKGIDIDAIKRKVLQKELLTSEELEAMSEEQIMNIIFWPGFSTGETVTDISGRGIGLDIVHTKISQLNGHIKVKSTLGKGCQVSLQIPVTMATINSFLVESNNQTFAIPTNSIKTTLLVKSEQVFSKEGKKAILVEDRTVPICKLSEVLDLPDNIDISGKLVIIVVQVEDIQIGFIVDRLIGDHEILHKNLSAPLIKVRNVAGITTLGSGDLCLILNVSDLIKSAYMKFGKTNLTPSSITVKSKEDGGKKNALVVDDSATTRILQKNILKSAGYMVDVATNGFDALSKLTSHQYDFIVSDIEMPQMNGFELIERVRQDKKYENIPVILVSSLASEEDRLKGINAGANAYITKGEFNQELLLNTIKRLIN